MQANHLDAVPALQSSVGVPSYGTRLFGYIIPPTSATYTFAVSGDDAAELRLSPSTDLAQAVTIAYTVQPTPRNVYSHSQSQRSKPIPLEADTPYAFEVLHKQAEGEDHVQVAWSTNGRPLAVIQHSALALFDTTHTHEDNALDESDLVHVADGDPHRYHRGELQRVAYVDDADVDGALPACEYSPSWVYRRAVARYEAATRFFVTESELFPTADHRLPAGEGQAKGGDHAPQPRLDADEARDVVRQYMSAVNADRQSRQLPALRVSVIHQVEAKRPKALRDGTRFLLEIDAIADGMDAPKRISRYVVRNHRRNLCYPTGWRWNKDAEVHVVVPVRNQAPWVRHLIKNIQRLTTLMHDPRITLVVVDFASTDADVEHMLSSSGVKHVYILEKEARSFSRALGIQRGVDVIEDPDAIVFACDLHLDMYVVSVPVSVSVSVCLYLCLRVCVCVLGWQLF